MQRRYWFAGVAFALLSGCGAATASPAPASVSQGGDDTSGVERDAYEQALPVFERYCSSCHTDAGGKPAALEHFSMDRYPFGGHHADNIAETIREVLGAGGEAPTMPKDHPGVVKGEELRLILAWADAFDREHGASAAHEHHEEGEEHHHHDNEHHDGDHHDGDHHDGEHHD